VDDGGGGGDNQKIGWYGILRFNVPLNTVQVISEMGGPEQ